MTKTGDRVLYKTDYPWCTYYFGPFGSSQDAELSQPGYLQDLLEEGAQIVMVKIKQLHPEVLTIFDDDVA